jgi:hypothetical protein
MLPKITATIVTCSLAITSFGTIVATENSTTSEAYIPSEIIEQLEPDEGAKPLENYIMVPAELEGNLLVYQEATTIKEIQTLIDTCTARKKAASDMANAARACGYPEDHPIILLAKEEWSAANEAYEQYKIKYDALVATMPTGEYPVAEIVWKFLTVNMGYSNYVAAGIMGNMMVECGGFTLKLDWDAINPSSKCYGLCQWHPRFHQSVQGGNLQTQLEYAAISFPYILKTQASAYRYNFTYEEFLNMTDVYEIAKAFCLIYERPGGYDIRRGDCAAKAYNYFVK